MGLYEAVLLTSSPLTLTVFILTVVALALTVYIWQQTRRDERLVKFAESLPGPPLLPIVGNALDFLGTGTDIMKRLEEYEQKYKSPYRLWIGKELYVSVSEVEDLEVIFQNSKLLGKPHTFDPFHDFWGDGIFTSGMDIWKKNRKKVQPTLGANALLSYVPEFNAKIYNTIEKLRHKVDAGEFDGWSYLPYLAFDIITKTSTELDVGSDEKLALAFHECVKLGMESSLFRMFKPWLQNKFFIALFYGSRISNARKAMYSFSEKILKGRLDFIKQDVEKRKTKRLDDDEDVNIKSFLTIAYELSLEWGKEKIMYDEITTMLTGGTDTTAITNCFFLMMMAIHPEIQDKVYDELYEVFGTGDRRADADDIRRLNYLDQTLKEVLRRYTLVPLIFRGVEEDTKIGNYVYPAGTTLAVSQYSVHFNPKYYPDPYRFNPDNFKPDVAESRNKYAFIPFSSGPRNCVGQAYAMLEMKLTMVGLLRHYEFHTTKKMEDLKLNMGFLLTSATGYKMRITNRDRRPTYLKK